MFDFLKSREKISVGKVAAIVAAAGESSRMSYKNKQFAEIAGKPVLAYSLEAFETADCIDEIIVVTRENDILLAGDIIKNYGITKAAAVIAGGNSRQESVKKGLEAAGECHIIAIHDGARPCVLPNHIELAVCAAREHGAAALGCPVSDTLKIVGEGNVIEGTVDRSVMWQIQTPQVFKSDVIRRAHQLATENNLSSTDDCALVEALGVKIRMVEGESSNIKITKPADLYIAEAIIGLREDEGA